MVKTTAQMVQDFIGDARGKRYAIGNAVFGDAKAAGKIDDAHKPLEKGFSVAEWFTSECKLLDIRVDVGFISTCLTASREGKRASKAGVFKQYMDSAISDRAAKELLDKAEGKAPKAKAAAKSDLEKAILAISKLDNAGKLVIASMLSAVKSAPIDTTLTASDTFERNAVSDVPCTLAEVKASIRSLTVQAHAYDAENGYNAVLETVTTLSDEIFGNPALSESEVKEMEASAA